MILISVSCRMVAVASSVNCARLRQQGRYELHWRVLDSLDHGLPQSRPRLYFVALRKTALVRRFRWPKPLARVQAAPFLDPEDSTPAGKGPHTMKQLNKVADGLDQIIRRGGDCLKEDWFLDFRASPSRGVTVRKDACGCLTRTRAGAGGPLITSRQRTMTMEELMRFQGFCDGWLQWRGIRRV